MAGRKVTYEIDVDESGAIVGTRKVEKGLKDVDNQGKKTNKTLGGLNKALNLIGVSSLGLVFAQGVRRAVSVGREFESQLAELEAITGITGTQLDRLGQRSLSLSKIYGTSASNIIQANKLVASQLAEKIDFGTEEGFQQLQQISEQAVILQKAAGIELSEAVETTTSIINQFNLSASESERVINTLAAGAKYGAAEVPAIRRALINTGTSAATAGQEIEVVNAAIQVLAANGQVGERAGTALNAIFLALQTSSKDLAKLGIQDVDIKANGLTATLRQLEPLLADTAAMERIFTREGMNAASVLIQNASSVENLTEKVTGTSVAHEQAAVNMDTFDGAAARLTATFDSELIPAFQETGGVVVGLMNNVSSLIEQFAGGIRQINAWRDAHRELNQELSVQQAYTDAQIASIVALRQELAEYALENELTVEQERELSESFDYTTSRLENRIQKVNEEKQALQSERAELQERLQSIEDQDLATQGWVERLIRVKGELEELDLKIANNNQMLGELEKALLQGKIGWDDYVASVQAANEVTEETSTSETVDAVEGISAQIKELKAEYQALLDMPDLDDAGVFQASSIANRIQELEELIERRNELANLGSNLDEANSEGMNDITSSLDDITTDLEGERDKNEQEYHNGRLVRIEEERQAKLDADLAEADSERKKQEAFAAAREENAKQMGRSIGQAVMYAKNVREATQNVVQAISAEIVSRAILGAFNPPTPASLVLAPILAAGATRLISSLIPKFNRGGIARGPSHEQGGIMGYIRNQAALELEGGEVVINKKSSRMFREELSAINVAGGGVPLAARGALTLNAMSRDNTPIPMPSRQGENLGREIREALKDLQLSVGIAKLNDETTDYDKLQNRIGN